MLARQPEFPLEIHAMKRTFCFALTFGLLAACGICSAVQRTSLPQETAGFAGSAANLEVSSVLPGFTSIALRSPQVEIDNLAAGFDIYQVFSIPGEPLVTAEGYPSVPQVGRLYRIPNTGSAELRITAAEFDVIDNIDAFPYQLEAGAFQTLLRDPVVYAADAWYPADVARISEPMIMRDFRVVNVTLYPVQVNPVTRQARIYHTLTAELAATAAPGANELINPRRPSGAFASLYRSAIANLDEHALDEATDIPGSYLILCHSDDQARQWADSLAIWKTRKGFRTVIDARTNWSAASMVSAIQAAYAAWDPPLEFVCIIGDPQWTFGLPSSGSAYDHDFARGNNGDEIEDIAVGRLSGNSGQMATINAKLMGYERNPSVTDPDWFRRGFFYAGASSNFPVASNYTLVQWGREQFYRFTEVNDITVAAHTASQYVDENLIRTQLQAGRGFFIWRGNWIGGMDNTLAGTVQTGWRLPVCLTITCNTGDFATGTGVSESWLVAGTPTNPTGAICGIGTASSGTHSPQNITLAGGLMYSIANLGVEHLGVALVGAKYWLFPTYGSLGDGSGPYARQFSRYCNLMGEPGLSMWTDSPVFMTVQHSPAINVGTRQVTVSVRRESDNSPVADALVTLWKRGADSTYALGRTNALGSITLPVTVNAAGELLLTVTKRNHKPYLASVPCATTGILPMFSSFTVDDDNSGGSQGNGDGKLNPGEVIDLPVTLRNYGTTGTAAGISAVFASGHPLVTVVQAAATYPNLPPGQSAAGSAAFRIQVSPLLQDDETVPFSLTVTASSGQTTGAFSLICESSNAVYVAHSFAGAFDPGTTRNLSVTVRNNGPLGLTGVTGRLQSLSPFVQVVDGLANFGSLPAGGQANNSGDPFVLTSNPVTYRGHRANLIMILTGAGGVIDSLRFAVNVGTASGSDPAGPDSYGYYAYDNTDTGYEFAPQFQYVNISAGLGTNLNLNDTGEKISIATVWSTARALPFDFTFYGTTYDSVTVCANGWLAFGNQAYFDNARNYPIPAMQAPDAMIAPYWDDLQTAGGGLGVWHYYDEQNHRYIVQWKARGYPSNTSLDFQVILFDPDFHPTLDGNGLVLVQYQTASMNLTGGSHEGTGCSIGIQDAGGLRGLSYAYTNQYTPGAATVTNGRAILFTTAARVLIGRVTGRVTDAATGLPLADAAVSLDGFPYRTRTADDGIYTIENVQIGSYAVRAGLARYNDAVVADVVVEENQTATVNLSLLHPEFALSDELLEITTWTDTPAQTVFSINNAGNGPLTYSIAVRFAGDANPDPWDSVAAIRVTEAIGDDQVAGVEFYRGGWWVSGAAGGTGENYLYKFDTQGNPAGAILQPGQSTFGWFDMATDGELLYGSDSPDIVGIDSLGIVQTTIPCPLNPARALAHDPATDHFWVADYTSDIYEIDRQGTVLQQIPAAGLSVAGLAWHAADAAGFRLYIFSQDGPGDTRVSRMHPVNHIRETVIDLPGEAGDRAGGCTITTGWNGALVVFGCIQQNLAGDRLGVYEMVFNSSWLTVAPFAAVIPGGTSQEITVAVNPASLRPDLYRIDLRIAGAVVDTLAILPLRVQINPGAASPGLPETAPRDYALFQNYPNPFNPVTTIRYALEAGGRTRLAVYNLLGERVALLVDAFQPAGDYALAFDASDLPSGMYFYRLESGRFSRSAKMVLMK